MTDLDRAWALMDRIDDGVAERIEPTPHGHLVASKRLHRVYDENFLRVRDAAMVSAEELAAEAEAAQGRFPELRHRRVNIRDGDHAARLEPGFVELGWAPERFVLMIQRRPPG